MAKVTDNVTSCVADLASDKSEVDFMVCTFKDKALLDVTESGTGGREAVVKYLQSSCEDKVATGAFLVLAVDNRGKTVSVRRKYVHYIWVGPKTPVMAKAKVASQSGKFKEVFAKTLTLSIQTDDIDDFSEAKLEHRLRAAGGAHQPTNFDFTNSSANTVTHTKGSGAIASAGAAAVPAAVAATTSAVVAAAAAKEAVEEVAEMAASAEADAVEAEKEEREPEEAVDEPVEDVAEAEPEETIDEAAEEMGELDAAAEAAGDDDDM